MPEEVKFYRGDHPGLPGEKHDNAFYWDATFHSLLIGKTHVGPVAYHPDSEGGFSNLPLNEGYTPYVSGLQSGAFGGFRYDKFETQTPDEEDNVTFVSGNQSYAFGVGHDVYGDWNFAAGKDSATYQRSSVALGNGCTAGDVNGTPSSYSGAVATGMGTKAIGYGSFSSGSQTNANGFSSVAMNNSTTASGRNSFAAGYLTVASGENQAVFGYYNKETTDGLFVVGAGSESDRSNVVEVRSNGTFILGRTNQSNAVHGGSYVGGINCVVGENATYAFAHGYHLNVNSWNQTAFGTYNNSDSTALFVIGNGGSEVTRSNAFEVLADGRAIVAAAPATSNGVARKLELDNLKDNIDTAINGLYETEKQERELTDNNLRNDLDVVQTDITSLQGDVNNLLNVSTDSNYLLNLINVIYPTGCVMFFYGSQDPNNMYYGTTWVQLSSGYMIRTKAKTTASGTGGQDSQSITLTTANLPSHNHSLNKQNIQTSSNGSGSFYAAGVFTDGTNANNAGSTSYTGSGSAFTVTTLPKYITLTAWRRTA